MGSAISALMDRFTKVERKMLILGLDNAGKTTILYNMHLGEVINTTPTIGFNVESIKYKKTHITAWDVGGQQKIRPLWRHYYHDTDGLIFVVDSCDTGIDRLSDVKEVLTELLNEDSLRGTKVLIFANKQDMRGAIRGTKLARKLEMGKYRNLQWHVQDCCGTTGEGLHAGLDWLCEAMNTSKK